MKKVFEFVRHSGLKLSEFLSDNEFFFRLSDGEAQQKISLYKIDEPSDEVRNLYLGHTMEEVLASGKDLLGEELMRDGDPEYSKVKSAMPIVTQKAYAFLGGPASWSGVTVEPDGSVLNQMSGRDREPRPIFIPSSVDENLGAIMPKRMLVGAEYPILISLHTDGKSSLELLYFVEPGDSDRDPIVWIRIKKYENANPESFSVEYKVAALAREGDEHLLNKNPPTEQIFLDALADTVFYWKKYSERGVQFDIPEGELARVARGAFSFASLTFTGSAPHYGHKFYGLNLHDNFPPNYIWSIEAACVSGRSDWAKKIFSHLLTYGVNDEGRICYRQGTGLCFGVSATEYGMLLFLANKYKSIFGLDKGIENDIAAQFIGMANEILSHCVPCPEFSNRVLVKMCAEADTNERINVYLNNNLWAIRGFEAISALLDGSGIDTSSYFAMAKTLRENVERTMLEYSAKETRFGTLVPFRFGYTPTPLTLSVCSDTFRPLTDEEKEFYFTTARTRGPESFEQDITENTYSNYRYYPEALCSMLLPTELADNIVKMRESLGGELLGMTRFRSWVDNWPVLHYARFLIESGRIEKYLLLLYAHTAHHGRPDLMAYYEQIFIDGTVKANDCVPSLLTTPIMLAWIFAYERVSDGKLQLLSALPKEWYKKPFSVKKLGSSIGNMDIESNGEKISFSFENPLPSGVELVWRAKDTVSFDDIVLGKEYVESINGNHLVIREGTKELNLIIK